MATGAIGQGVFSSKSLVSTTVENAAVAHPYSLDQTTYPSIDDLTLLKYNF